MFFNFFAYLNHSDAFLCRWTIFSNFGFSIHFELGDVQGPDQIEIQRSFKKLLLDYKYLQDSLYTVENHLIKKYPKVTLEVEEVVQEANLEKSINAALQSYVRRNPRSLLAKYILEVSSCQDPPFCIYDRFVRFSWSRAGADVSFVSQLTFAHIPMTIEAGLLIGWEPQFSLKIRNELSVINPELDFSLEYQGGQITILFKFGFVIKFKLGNFDGHDISDIQKLFKKILYGHKYLCDSLDILEMYLFKNFPKSKSVIKKAVQEASLVPSIQNAFKSFILKNPLSIPAKTILEVSSCELRDFCVYKDSVIFSWSRSGVNITVSTDLTFAHFPMTVKSGVSVGWMPEFFLKIRNAFINLLLGFSLEYEDEEVFVLFNFGFKMKFELGHFDGHDLSNIRKLFKKILYGYKDLRVSLDKLEMHFFKNYPKSASAIKKAVQVSNLAQNVQHAFKSFILENPLSTIAKNVLEVSSCHLLKFCVYDGSVDFSWSQSGIDISISQDITFAHIPMTTEAGLSIGWEPQLTLKIKNMLVNSHLEVHTGYRDGQVSVGGSVQLSTIFSANFDVSIGWNGFSFSGGITLFNYFCIGKCNFQ